MLFDFDTIIYAIIITQMKCSMYIYFIQNLFFEKITYLLITLVKLPIN